MNIKISFDYLVRLCYLFFFFFFFLLISIFCDYFSFIVLFEVLSAFLFDLFLSVII